MKNTLLKSKYNIFKKVLFKTFVLLLSLVVLVSLTFVDTNADSDFQYVKKSDGGYITYRNTDIKVEIPTTYNQKSTEFRGVWVSAFAGDISGFKSTQSAFQNSLLALLDNLEAWNLNAVVFHIRTHNDAFYDTKLAPKSDYISEANFKEWDYLEWFIDECHARGIEFHAWLNPYRISSSKTTFNDIQKRYSDYRFNPAYKEENVLVGTNGAILDPGRPAVKEYLVDVCMEIIEKYDVDAIHFDDYFYLAGVNDNETYNLYKSKYGNPSLANFRRLQVDDFIQTLSEEMKQYNLENNRAVQLGISPSGVYRNGSYSTNYVWDNNGTLISPLASNTAGYAHYDSPLYSDTKKWIDNEWIDYITPQLYGSFESVGASYADAAYWWSQVVKYKDVNLYTGLGIYKYVDKSDIGWYHEGNRTFEYSLLYNQLFDSIDGFCLYQYKTLSGYATRNPDFVKVLTTMTNNKALTPVIPRYSLQVDEVENLKLVKGSKSYTLLFDKVEGAYKYAIYRAEGNIDINNPDHLIGIVGNEDINNFTDKNMLDNCTYGVRAISRNNELSDLVTIKTSEATTDIDIDFGKFNEIEFEGQIKSNSYFVIVLHKATVYVGENVSYKVYSSFDQENWNLEKEYDPIEGGTISVRLQYNDILRPVYYKFVMTNEFGEIESEIIKVDYTNAGAQVILDYSLNRINGLLNNMLGISKE